MTRIDFYSGAKDKLRTACQLSHKAVSHGLPVQLYLPDEETCQAMDTLLWSYPPTAFLPHCRNHDADAGSASVLLTHNDKIFPHCDILISLHTECLPFFSRFERIIEIVSDNQEDEILARVRYSFYRDRGYTISHIDLRQPQGANLSK